MNNTISDDKCTPILPTELWTEHIIPAVFVERGREYDAIVYGYFYNSRESSMGKMYSIAGEIFRTSFTLTAIKRTCKAFSRRIEPYKDSLFYKYKPEDREMALQMLSTTLKFGVADCTSPLHPIHL